MSAPGTGWRGRTVRALWVGLLVAGAASLVAQDDQVFTNFRYPVKDKEGRVKADLFARTFRIPEQGLVQVEGLEWRMRGDAEGPAMVVSSESCRFNRESNVIASEAPIRIERPDMVMTGTGYICDLSSNSFIILSDARVELRGKSLWRIPGESKPQP